MVSFRPLDVANLSDTEHACMCWKGSDGGIANPAERKSITLPGSIPFSYRLKGCIYNAIRLECVALALIGADIT